MVRRISCKRRKFGDDLGMKREKFGTREAE